MVAPAGTVQVRLDHLQGEGGGDGGVERVAAFFQDAHAHRGRNPVGRGDHAEHAFDFGAGGGGIGIDIAPGYPWLRSSVKAAQLTTASALCQLVSRCCDHTPIATSAGLLTAWQATPSISLGASRRQRSKNSGQRGLKAQPAGGLIGFGISPLTGIRWRPDIARSGTAPSSILV